MSLRKVFKDLTGEVLFPRGYIYKKGNFYQYIPNAQILKTVSLDTYNNGRGFRLWVCCECFSDGIQLSGDSTDGIGIDRSGLYAQNYVERRVGKRLPEHRPFFEKHCDETFADFLNVQLKAYDATLFSAMDTVKDLASLYAFKCHFMGEVEMEPEINSLYMAIQLGDREEAQRLISYFYAKQKKEHGEHIKMWKETEAVLAQTLGWSQEEQQVSFKKEFPEAAWIFEMAKRISEWRIDEMMEEIRKITVTSKAVCDAFFLPRNMK